MSPFVDFPQKSALVDFSGLSAFADIANLREGRAAMIAKNPRDVGLLMREQRRKLGLDQGELARLARVSRQWVIEVEQGKARAEVGLVLRALAVLGLTLDIQEARQRLPQAGAPASVDFDSIIERARAGNGQLAAVARPRAGAASKKKPGQLKKARAK